MSKSIQKPAQQKPFTAAEVIKSAYVVKPTSRVYQFRNAPGAYKVNPDGSISSRAELDYFN
jgi:hypothetical protein